jgi:hypothetical protein
MTDAEKLEIAAAKYKAGREREFKCDRDFVRPERQLSALDKHTKAIHEKRFQRLREAE